MAIVPTAFIKKQTLPSTAGEEKVITWSKDLYWGQQGSPQTTSTWPFSNGIDLIHEFFNLERKFNNDFLSKSVKLFGKSSLINKSLIQFADNGRLL